MASFQLLPHLHLHSHFPNLKTHKFNRTSSRPLTKASIFHKISAALNTENGVAVDSPKPQRKPRKKKSDSSTSPPTARKTRRSKKDIENDAIDAKQDEIDENYDDGIDFPYEDPPLICCFGSAQKEFVLTVRVHDNPMDQDKYSEWKMLQWDPPEFVRAPGGPPSNVAVAHVRLGGRAAFMGKVGDDEFGKELVLMMNEEKVQTRGVKLDVKVKTACTLMKIKFDGDGKLKVENAKEPAENSLSSSELNISVLKEVISGLCKFRYA